MRSKIFLTLDSLRWDVFEAANIPYLRSLGPWKKAQTQATYTFPAHMSFFVGKLPNTFDKTDYYDYAAMRMRFLNRGTFRHKQLWRLGNPEAPRDAVETVEGENMIKGFAKAGYRTIGSGAMHWFNPTLPAGRYLSEPFQHFKFFNGPEWTNQTSAPDQVEFALETIRQSDDPFFLFINFGETHHPFFYRDCEWWADTEVYGNAKKCFQRQQACLEYLDRHIQTLLTPLTKYELVICADHGEVMGEDGLWGHSFAHPKIFDVPMLIKV